MTIEQITTRIKAAGYILYEDEIDGFTAYKCGYYYNMPSLPKLYRILFEQKYIHEYTNEHGYYVITCNRRGEDGRRPIECHAFKRLHSMTLQELLNRPELQDNLMSWRKVRKYLKIQRIQFTTKIHEFGSWSDGYAKERLKIFKSVPLCYQYFPTLGKSHLHYVNPVILRGIEFKIPTDYQKNIIFD